MDMTSQAEPVGSPTILMMTDPLRYLPRARHHATICTAGSKGYCAVKEMLQSGAPGHTLLIESGDLRNVENSSMECCLIYTCSPDDHHFYSRHFPFTIEHLAVYSNGACIPPAILANAGIRSVDLSGLSHTRQVHLSFLDGCTELTTLDLSPLSHITVAQWYFLRGCSGLTALDLSPLSHITVVQGFFLRGCSGLTTLDLSPLTQVKVVQGYFLQGCSGLTALNLTLSQVTEVHCGFLEGCSGLTRLDLSTPSEVTVIQPSFLQGCSGLMTLDLSGLSQVTKIQSSFLKGCSGLTRLDLSGLSQVTGIQPYGFLEGCTSLDEVISPPQCPSGWTSNSIDTSRL